MNNTIGLGAGSYPEPKEQKQFTVTFDIIGKADLVIGR